MSKMDQLVSLEKQLDAIEANLMRLTKARAADEYGELENDASLDQSREPDQTDYDELADDDDKDDDLDSLARKIAKRERCSGTKAMVEARVRRPDLYRAMGEELLRGEQPSYGELVDTEIRKGCSETVARQRVSILYPGLAEVHLVKRRSSEGIQFLECANAIRQKEGLSRTAAMQKARRLAPQAFQSFQSNEKA